MAKFVNMENDKDIIDFSNMTVKQFRYLVRKATEINEEDMKKTMFLNYMEIIQI